MEERYEAARKRVEELKGFYIHFAMYVVVISGLFVIDAVTGGGWWFFWPAIGWGIGITIHAVALVFEDGLLGTKWEERKIQKLLDKEHVTE